MIEARVDGGQLVVSDGNGTELLRAHGEVRLSDGRVLSSVGDDVLQWQIEPGRPSGVVIRLRFHNDDGAAVHVEQLRPLVAPNGYAGAPLRSLRISQTGWQSWSRAHPPAPFEPNRETAAPPIRGPYLPHRQADSQLEPWMTILVPPDGAALLVGFVRAEDQLGTVEIVPGGDGHTLIAATELDGTPLEGGAELVSEPLLLAQGAEQDLLDRYATQVAVEMRARPPGDVPTGWCSWYQLYTDVTEADVERNLSSLVAHRDQVSLRLIQLDDGYETAIGDWLDLKPTFPGGMRSLVKRIRDHGFMPGLWLAPFLLSARSHTFAEHPDWVVRDERGEPLKAIDNWGSANYAVDTSHPAVMDWLEHVLHTVCDDWGYEYLKLDFLYAAAMRGQRHDPNVTAVQAYRRGMERIRRIVGDRFVLGCGAPLLPSVGIVDGMRIGSDVAAYWGREGNSDGPALRNAVRATLSRMWMHGHWWANDPDCVVVRASDTQLSLAEVQAWAGVVALSGGMVFVGDDVSRVAPERLALLARLLPPSGQAAQSGPPLVGLMAERLHLRVERPWGDWSVIGIANWSDDSVAVCFDPSEFVLPSGAVHVVDQWTGAYLGAHTQPLELGDLPPHGLRLLSIHPDLGRPQTIGSTGHLLGAVMDLANEQWDPQAHILSLQLTSQGPPARTGELLVFDPNGPLRRVPLAMSEPRGVRLQFA